MKVIVYFNGREFYFNDAEDLDKCLCLNSDGYDLCTDKTNIIEFVK